MKNILLSIILISVGFISTNAQVVEADTLVAFETQADTTGWEVFANGAAQSDDDIMLVANPDMMGVNPSDSALQFTVHADADPWAGIVNNVRYVGDSAIMITQENHMLTIMVYKTKISNVGLKLEREVNLGDNLEIKVPNSLINQWEMLTFDFSEAIGRTYEALVIFPDFPDTRTEGTVAYVDNVLFALPPSTSVNLTEKLSLKVYPNPAHNKLYLQLSNMTGYAISNILGQTVSQVKFGATDLKTVDVARLNNGIHFITVESKSGLHTTRFIKK